MKKYINKIFDKKILSFLFLITFILVKKEFFTNLYILDAKQYTATSCNTEFIEQVASIAIEDAKVTGIYPSVTIAQAIIESGWGKDEIATKYNNYFGMKCSANGTGYANEFWNGSCVNKVASEGGRSYFRVYSDLRSSVRDHGRNFWVTSTYSKHGVANAMKDGLGPQEQLYRIAKSGYAVDASGNITVIGGLTYDAYLYQKFIVGCGLDKYDKQLQAEGGWSGEAPNFASGIAVKNFVDGNFEGLHSSSTNNLNIGTTYTGDIKNGYIYYRFKEKFEKWNNETKITNEINDSINEIYSRAFKSTFTGSSSGSIITDPTGGDYSSWKQCDGTWGSIPIGSSGRNICQIGCLVTSVSIQIKRSETAVNTSDFNPGNFIKELNSKNAFDAGGNFYWRGWEQIAPNWKFDGKEKLPSSWEGKLSKISELLNQGYYPVMCVKKNCGHWVAVTGVANNNILIIDPGSNATTVLPSYQNIANDSTLTVAKFKKND